MEERRDQISSRYLAQMKKQALDEDERIAREIAETDEQEAREAEVKKEKHIAELQSIKEHRMDVVRKKYMHCCTSCFNICQHQMTFFLMM